MCLFIHKDILNIVYRYIHDFNYKRLKAEYNVEFKQFFHDEYHYFIHVDDFNIYLRCGYRYVSFLCMISNRRCLCDLCRNNENDILRIRRNTPQPIPKKVVACLPDHYYYSNHKNELKNELKNDTVTQSHATISKIIINVSSSVASALGVDVRVIDNAIGVALGMSVGAIVFFGIDIVCGLWKK
jgi:hypothetical protein